MKRLNFEIDINASGENVWNTLWSDTTYPQWTSVFGEGMTTEASKAITDWQEGSKVHFVAGTEGMYSVIDKKQPNEYMAFKHLGVVKNGEEQPLDEETKKWSGSMETYTLKESNGKTNLRVELDTVDEMSDYFGKVFPKALEKVKQIAEAAK